MKPRVLRQLYKKRHTNSHTVVGFSFTPSLNHLRNSLHIHHIGFDYKTPFVQNIMTLFFFSVKPQKKNVCHLHINFICNFHIKMIIVYHQVDGIVQFSAQKKSFTFFSCLRTLTFLLCFSLVL